MTNEELEKMSNECVATFRAEKDKAQEIANTILQQLGGNMFAMMTGAKNFTILPLSENYPCGGLSFTIDSAGGFNSTGINKVYVTLNGNDTYTMTFKKVRKGFVRAGKYYDGKNETIKKYDEVYCEALRDVFYRVTNLMCYIGQK